MSRKKNQKRWKKGETPYSRCKTDGDRENMARLGTLADHQALLDDLMIYDAMVSEPSMLKKASKQKRYSRWQKPRQRRWTRQRRWMRLSPWRTRKQRRWQKLSKLAPFESQWKPEEVAEHRKKVEELTLDALSRGDAEFFKTLSKCLEHIHRKDPGPAYPLDLPVLWLKRLGMISEPTSVPAVEKVLTEQGIEFGRGSILQVLNRLGLDLKKERPGRKKL